ncbi:MAG: sulfite exporter TauE/SafE family protein [Alphaproteobacteria bacterium]|nr:sulfite exporter TauE/SafE family protein [Alphaproteobacteria bacterium]
MIIVSFLIFFAAAFAAGIINALAGGGSFLTFPALLLTGLDARAANITSTIALFPMQLSTGYAGRKMAGDSPSLSLKELCGISLIGGVIGASLLLLTTPAFFAKLVPWLILFATVVFAYGSFRKKPDEIHSHYHLGRAGSILSQFLISIYGGYFGGGIGFLMLAALTLGGMAIRKAGATKNILAGIMNASAVIIFLFSKDIAWAQAGVGIVGSVLGGFVGVRLLHKVNERLLRTAIVVLGLALTVAMFTFPK